jgi:hypothetical protein
MNDMLLAVLISIGLLLIVASLPLVPSTIIYRLFPDTVVAANGPLSGLTVRTTGAFSVYIIVFLCMVPFVYRTYDSISSLTSPSWTIQGNIILKDSNGRDIVDPATIKSLRVGLTPDIIETDGDSFTVKVPEIEHRIPNLTFSVGELGSKVVNVNKDGDYKIDRDTEHLAINIRSPIVVRLIRSGNYNPGAAPLAALTTAPAPADAASPGATAHGQ